MKVIAPLTIMLFMLSSCDSLYLRKAESNITPFGPDTYTVTYTGRNYASTRTIVFKAANNYCQKEGKLFLPKNESSRPGYNRNSVELVFRCLDVNDPEMKRQEWEHVPDTVIEDRRTK